jgi:gamma-glutamylcyclotransferase (GGCT)/AIG2-like uncharacterized protein YtfP
MKIFFYGTLRKGGHFSRGLPKDRKIHLCQLEGVRVYKLGWFPGATITGEKEDYIVGEVNDFEGVVSQEEWDAMVANWDRIEGVSAGLFERKTIETPHGEAIIYTASDETLESAADQVKRRGGKGLEIVNDWAEVDRDVAEGVKTLKEKNNVTVRTAEQKD